MKDQHLNQVGKYPLTEFLPIALESPTEDGTHTLIGSPTTIQNNSRLLEAILTGDAKKVQALLVQNIYLDCGDTSDDSPLFIAMNKGYNQIVTLLFNHATNINHENSWQDNALLHAAADPNTHIVRPLLHQGASVETCDLEGNTPLLRAACIGNIVTITLLLNHQARINHMNVWKESALILAASKGYIEIAALLIQRGADINAKDLQRNTSLLLALQNDHPEIAELLINHNANIHDVNSHGESALILAVLRSHIAIAQSLSNKNARFPYSSLLKRPPQCLSDTITSKDIQVVSLLAYYNYYYRPHIMLINTNLREKASAMKAIIIPIIERQQTIQYLMNQLQLDKNAFCCPGAMYDFPTVIDLLYRLNNNIVLRLLLTLLGKRIVSDEQINQKKTPGRLTLTQYLPKEIKDSILIPLIQSLVRTPEAYKKGLSFNSFPSIAQKHLNDTIKLSNTLHTLGTALQIYIDNINDRPIEAQVNILTALTNLFAHKPDASIVEQEAERIIKAAYCHH